MQAHILLETHTDSMPVDSFTLPVVIVNLAHYSVTLAMLQQITQFWSVPRTLVIISHVLLQSFSVSVLVSLTCRL